MVREHYKGFVIEARANELQDEIGWSPILIIESHDGSGVSETEVPIRGVYETRNAAIDAAIGHARRKIERAWRSAGQKSKRRSSS